MQDMQCLFRWYTPWKYSGKRITFLFLSFFSMPYKTMKKSTKAFSVLLMRHTSKLILHQHVTFQLSQVMRLFNKTLWQSNNKWMSVHHKARIYIYCKSFNDVMVKDPMTPRVLWHLVHVCKLWTYTCTCKCRQNDLLADIQMLHFHSSDKT